MTTFSHNPFQPPHFSVSHGTCPNIWDFNKIKSKRILTPLKNTRKLTNSRFPPLRLPCRVAGMGVQGGLVVMWGGCHARAALLALWPPCLGAQVVLGVSTFPSLHSHRAPRQGVFIRPSSAHTRSCMASLVLLRGRELVVLEQHPCVPSCLKQCFESHSCWRVFILSPAWNPARSCTSAHTIQDPQRALSRFVTGEKKNKIALCINKQQPTSA